MVSKSNRTRKKRLEISFDNYCWVSLDRRSSMIAMTDFTRELRYRLFASQRNRSSRYQARQYASPTPTSSLVYADVPFQMMQMLFSPMFRKLMSNWSISEFQNSLEHLHQEQRNTKTVDRRFLNQTLSLVVQLIWRRN